MANLKFNKTFWRDLWKLLTPYWRSEERWSAYGLLISTIICSFIGVRASVALNQFINKDITEALQSYDLSKIYWAVLQVAIALIVLLCAYGYSFYFQARLSIRWRKWLTQNYLTKWLHQHNHYYMQLNHQSLDNPDQRISEDLAQFPDITLTISFLLFQALASIVSFGYLLLSAGPLTIPMHRFTLVISGYLLWASLLYVVLGFVMTKWVGRKLANLDYHQQYYNADFRFSLVRIREGGEQIALYRGEKHEQEKLSHLFNRIFKNFNNIISVKKNLMFLSTGYSMSTVLLGTCITLPLYLQKKLNLGGMLQMSNGVGNFIANCTVFINAFTAIAQWRAVVARLTEFEKATNVAAKQISQEKIIKEWSHEDLLIQQLSLFLPDGQLLVDNLHFKFQPAKTYLIKGPSGIGKSIFLKTLAGLWPYASGNIFLPKDKKIFFLPQKPYMPLGSLRDVIVYLYDKSVTDLQLSELLELCLSQKFCNKLNDIKNWSQELSLGEQQLIAFARIFLNKPDMVVLDEATSALDENAEETIYLRLRKFLPEITIISVGHRSSLDHYHDCIMEMRHRKEFMAQENVF